MVVLIVLNTAYCMPLFFDKELFPIEGVNETMYGRRNTALGDSYTYQWVYKTVLFYVIMYAIPLMILAVLTVLLLRALKKAKKARENMTTQAVSA